MVISVQSQILNSYLQEAESCFRFKIATDNIVTAAITVSFDRALFLKITES